MPNEPEKLKSAGRVGLLTFQWADNFGALLQAYGLLAWLTEQGIDAFSVNYAPSALRGRDWLFPYAPFRGMSKRTQIKIAVRDFLKNLWTGPAWWAGKRAMGQFREQYLVKGSRAMRRLAALSKVDMDQLVVGSDQIWNPEITFGFQPAYFGAFEHPRLKKTVAYAASFGTAALPPEAEEEFSRLLDSVSEISIREKSAAGYIRTRFHREAVHVADPVFLLRPEQWSAIEERPSERGYILYHETEYNEELRRTAYQLAEEKKLALVELSYKKKRQAMAFQTAYSSVPSRIVYSAGPRQFLGYIHGADYVVSSSFHALAFCLLFHRPFCTRNHRAVPARIDSLLETVGLTGRMAREDYHPDIDAETDWAAVDESLQAITDRSKEYLLRSLMS